jgi:hypothetical protein
MMSDRIRGKSDSAAAYPVFGCSLETEASAVSGTEFPAESP